MRIEHHHPPSRQHRFRVFGACAALVAGSVVLAAPSLPDLALTAQISRKLAQDQLVRQAAYVLAIESTTDTDGYALPPAPAAGAGPSGGGVIPSSSAAPKTDGYGVNLGYCAWDNGSVTNHPGYIAGTASMGAVTIAVVSPGTDNVIQTTCAQIASPGGAASGDDSYVSYTSGQVLAGVQGSTYFADAVNTVPDLASIAAGALKDGQVRLVKATNSLYRYDGSGWSALTVAWQNGATPGDIYYTAGKVSIGKNAGSYTLDVGGAVRADSAGNTAGFWLGNGSGTNVGQFWYDAAAQRAALEAHGSNSLSLATGGAERVRILTDGRIGIGKSSPSYKLDVNGPIRADSGGDAGGFWLGDGSGSNVGQFWYDAALQRATLEARGSNSLSLAAGGAEHIRIQTNGWVGIGTNAPSTTLDVNGNVNITGSLASTGGASFAGTVNAAAINVNGVPVTPSNYVLKTGDTMSGALTINNALTVNAGLLTANAGMVSTAVTTGTVGTASATPLLLRAGGVEQMRIQDAGRVGIGKQNPAYKLDVLGAIRADSANGFLIGDGSAVNVGQVSYNGSSMVTLEAKGARSLGFETNGTERIRIDDSGNIKVGGGAPKAWSGGFVPVQIMHSSVAAYRSGGTIKTEINTNAYQSALDSHNRIGAYGSLRYQQDLAAGHVWSHAATGAADSAITWIHDMTIDTTGNVGIGKAAASGYKLDAWGAGQRQRDQRRAIHV
jgi:hypothetical protein